VLVSPHSAIRWQAIQKRFDEVGTPAPGANKRPFVVNRSEQSEVPERLLNRCNLFRRARILVVGRPGCSETEQLVAMCDPGTLGHKAMLARNPFLDSPDPWHVDECIAGYLEDVMGAHVVDHRNDCSFLLILSGRGFNELPN
jgi:hypothetical protein